MNLKDANKIDISDNKRHYAALKQHVKKQKDHYPAVAQHQLN